MAEITQFTNGKISCPNHNEPLEGLSRPLPKKGTGRCPVSGASFSFEVDPEEHKLSRTVDGRIIKIPKVTVKGND